MPLQLGHVAERHPDASLILAHAAIVAQAGIGKLARSVENIFFDSSTWTPLDQLNLLSLVPPEQILWASDIPYGEPLAALNVFVRAARMSGAGDDLLRGMLRDNALGLLEGTPARARARRRSREPEFHTSYARVRATHVHGRARRRCCGWACPSTSASSASPRRRCTRTGLDEQAELVRCAAPSGPSGPRRSSPARRPTWSAAGRVWRLLNQAQADTVLA